MLERLEEFYRNIFCNPKMKEAEIKLLSSTFLWYYGFR